MPDHHNPPVRPSVLFASSQIAGYGFPPSTTDEAHDNVKESEAGPSHALSKREGRRGGSFRLEARVFPARLRAFLSNDSASRVAGGGETDIRRACRNPRDVSNDGSALPFSRPTPEAGRDDDDDDESGASPPSIPPFLSRICRDSCSVSNITVYLTFAFYSISGKNPDPNSTSRYKHTPSCKKVA